MQATAKALPRLDEDNRLIPILDNLSKGFQAGISSEWSNASEGADGQLTADMIDEMAYKHYPACMRNLHMCLRRDKHLKHFGRLQYGLFLKVSPPSYRTQMHVLMQATDPRAVYRGSSGLLAEGVQHDAGRQIQQGVQVQHPAHVRSRRQTSELCREEVRCRPVKLPAPNVYIDTH